MSSLIDLTGQKINRLTIIERDYEYVTKNNIKKKSVYWKCQCDCGNVITIRSDHLKSGKIKSCGCYQKDNLSKNLSNKKFGKLTALYKTDKQNKNGHIFWHCKCECGNECEIPSSYLINGHTQSCGCLNSKGEAVIQRTLELNNIKFEKEKWFKDFIYTDTKRHPKYDFYLPDYNRLIEFDGEQHFKENPLFNKKVSLKTYQHRDLLKNDYAKKNNIKLIRIPYYELNNITIEMLLGEKYLID